MSTIGKNIRKIRTVKKLSQAAFAELFHLARPSVGAYEEGRAEPKIETVIQMANYFGISIDSLLTKELTINDLYKFDLHANEILVKPAKEKKEDVPYGNVKSLFVSGGKQIEYLVQLNSKDFLSDLPRILVPGYEKENIRAFEMTSEDMHDNLKGINVGDIVIGKRIENAGSAKLKVDSVYVAVLKSELVIRRLEAKGEKLILKADNSHFPSKSIDPEELLELWEVLGFFTKNIKPPSVLADRVMHLENLIEKLEGRVKKLEKGR